MTDLTKLRHLVRYRMDSDSDYLASGAMDAVLINANHLEHHLHTTAARTKQLGLPYLVDPMLWRFQVPAWWRRQSDGATKKNFVRLAAHYFSGTNVCVADSALGPEVSDGDWRQIAANVILYEKARIVDEGGGLLAMMEGGHAPAALIAPYLLANSPTEDRINRLLIEAAASQAGSKVIGHLALPVERIKVGRDLDEAADSIASDNVLGCFIWTERLTEERLYSSDADFDALLHIIDRLASKGIALWHAHGHFTAAALTQSGLTGLAHNLYWVDYGMQAAQPKGTPHYSTRTYVPGLHQTLHFNNAIEIGRGLSIDKYRELYCSCHFCSSLIEHDQHPLDSMLEVMEVPGARGGIQYRPTDRALGANTYHYLWARQQEMAMFAANAAHDVLVAEVLRGQELLRGPSRLEKLLAKLPRAS